jgi:hypothetical protein
MSKYIKKNKPPITHCRNGHEFTPENTGIRKNGRNPSLLTRACKECQKLRLRKYCAQYPEKRKGRVSKYKASIREKKAQLVEYKGGKCVDCGGVFPSCCYHFDHKDPLQKSAGIAQLMHKPLEEIKLEADKCDLVCANCHAIRTFGNTAVGQKISSARQGKWKV